MFAHSYRKLSRTCYGESTPYARQTDNIKLLLLLLLNCLRTSYVCVVVFQIFYQFVSFLTPGIIYHCDMTLDHFKPSVTHSFLTHGRCEIKFMKTVPGDRIHFQLTRVYLSFTFCE